MAPPPPADDLDDSDNEATSAAAMFENQDDDDDVNGTLSHYLYDTRFSARILRTSCSLPKRPLLIASEMNFVRRFNVTKANSNQRSFTKKIRVWEIDLLQ